MRPFYKLVGDQLQRSTEFEEGYDGSAWEFYGDPGIVLRTVGPASAAARHGLYILGNLVDFKQQGSTVRLLGNAKTDGRRAYQLRVRMLDGFEQDEFIDAQTWLVVADRKVAKVHAFGGDVASETRWSDYQIFQERDDADAVQWTYHDFRNAYPETNTEVAMEVIGYQSLKMGSVAAAVALLEHNLQDYPLSADAAFGLGRAYKMAGRKPEAKAEFERALAIDPNQQTRDALAELAVGP